MSKGFVYILSNKSMPGLLKIGKTTRSLEARLNELYQTGVPTPFEVEDWYPAMDCGEVEQKAHAQLSKYRINESREFFDCDVFTASHVLSSLATRQVEALVQEFAPDCKLLYAHDYPDPKAIDRLSKELGLDKWSVLSAIGHLHADELRPAIEREKKALDDFIESTNSTLKVVK